MTKASATLYKAVASQSESLVPIGTVEFVDDGSGQGLRLSGSLSGLQAGQKHGFHVHETGLLFDHCMDAKEHYNPAGAAHGGPSDSERHVGDLGNVEADVSRDVRGVDQRN